MLYTFCGRTGCRFPIGSDRILCHTCTTAFHPECSNLSPEEYALKSKSRSWSCLTCALSAMTPEGNPEIPINALHTCSHSALPSLPLSYVTSNSNKLRETVAILGEKYAGMLKQVDIDLPEYQGSSPEEIARLKCLCAASQINGPVLVEDTCLAFDALKGLPGPYIKWFLNAVGPEGLNKMLDGFRNMNEEKNGDEASAICTFAYTSGREGEVEVMQGITRGRIVAPRGTSHFGWDSCFLPSEVLAKGLTYAQMSGDMKNAISHRSKAVAKLRCLLDRLSSSSTPSG